MTPRAITFAGKGETSTGHRRALRKRPSPSSPRRVSGPAGGRPATPGGRAATATARAASAPAARPAAARLRTARRRRAPAPARATGSLPVRAVAFVRALPDHALLDRMVRGRAWIAMLGVMLAGIVAMQVEVLKLGAGVGRSLQEGTTLQSRNQLLRASVASLADDQRIERMAAQMGMVMPAPTAVVFLSPHSAADAQHAAANIHAPDSTTFLAALPPTGPTAVGATAAGQAPSAGTMATTQATSTPVTSTPATTTPVSTGATAPTSATTAGGATGATPTADTTTGGSAPGATGAAVTVSPPTTTPPATPTGTATGDTSGAAATGAAAIAPAGTTSTGG